MSKKGCSDNSESFQNSAVDPVSRRLIRLLAVTAAIGLVLASVPSRSSADDRDFVLLSLLLGTLKWTVIYRVAGRVSQSSRSIALISTLTACSGLALSQFELEGIGFGTTTAFPCILGAATVSAPILVSENRVAGIAGALVRAIFIVPALLYFAVPSLAHLNVFRTSSPADAVIATLFAGIVASLHYRAKPGPSVLTQMATILGISVLARF